jgi:uncharacterized repeat protein (TIGR01451 family)
MDSTTTDGSGNYTIWIPGVTPGNVGIVMPPRAGMIATGGSAGTTGGAYVRSTNTSTFTTAPGNTYSGVNFGVVPVNIWLSDAIQGGTPGSSIAFAHAFTAGSAGTVTFAMTATTSSGSVWSQTLYHDTNCNGMIDAAEPALVASMAVVVDQKVCLVMKQFVPTGAAVGTHNAVVVGATMAYANAAPALSAALTNTDTTTLGAMVNLTLTKLVRNITTGAAFTTSNAASPNDIIEYQLIAKNLSSGTVSNVVVNDATPAFTAFVSAACPVSLPATITVCNTAHPSPNGAGAINWTFGGALPSGASLTITFQVRVSP